MKKIYLLIIGITVLFLKSSFAQDDMMDLISADNSKDKTEYTYATFKTTRIIHGQSIENPAKGDLLFIISHHFGTTKDGVKNWFGLDNSSARYGFEYGLTNNIGVGIGRAVYQKTYNTYLKYKFLRQSTGKKFMPVSMSAFASMAVRTDKWDDVDHHNSDRMSYVYQLLIASKITNALSAQITPSLIHKNIIYTTDDKNNDLLACGTGVRYKFTNRMSLNVEYFYMLPKQRIATYHNVFSIGLDIETGGHIFQVYVSNAASETFERAFISEVQGDWMKRDIYIGFNINRIFTLGKKEK